MWTAGTGYVEPLSKLLRSLRVNKAFAHVTILPDGIKVQVLAPSKTFTSQLFLEPSLFATYDFSSADLPELGVTISLNALVHCLQMFMEWNTGDDALSAHKQAGVCFLTFSQGGHFRVSFAHDTMTSQCDIVGMQANYESEVDALHFDSENVRVQAIMVARVFGSVLRDLEAVSASEAAIVVNLRPPQIVIRGIGDAVTSEFVLPNEASVLEAFMADGEYECRYKVESLIKCHEAVKLSRRVSLRCDEQGVLSVQCLSELDERPVYLEFRFLPIA